MAQDTESLSSDPWLLQIALAICTFALPRNQPWSQPNRSVPPRLHYLLSCPATAALRPEQPPPTQPGDCGLLTICEIRAALLVRRTPSDVMLWVLRASPPPR